MPERDASGQPSAEEQVRALYENAESTAARAFERAVATPSFGAMLARSAENVAALTRMGSDAADLMLRNLRLAGRSDITRLARQLHRTEDKLERVLQEIEQLRDELARAQSRGGAERPARPERTANGQTSAASGRAAAGRGSTGNGRTGGTTRSGGRRSSGARGGSGGTGSGSRTT